MIINAFMSVLALMGFRQKLHICWFAEKNGLRAYGDGSFIFRPWMRSRDINDLRGELAAIMENKMKVRIKSQDVTIISINKIGL